MSTLSAIIAASKIRHRDSWSEVSWNGFLSSASQAIKHAATTINKRGDDEWGMTCRLGFLL